MIAEKIALDLQRGLQNLAANCKLLGILVEFSRISQANPTKHLRNKDARGAVEAPGPPARGPGRVGRRRVDVEERDLREAYRRNHQNRPENR